ncbi:hypothetical protein [Streptomyces sediminimaris]|uniref:hypothetical protein n=1 Tax=Streptomyces sediminimaris TaxID=3383721 RepID=UPI00399A790C
MSYEDDRAQLEQRVRHALRTQPPRILTSRNSAWMHRSGLCRWIGYALHEPREFVYSAPRRIACRLFGWHNPTCVGRPAPHPRRW